MGALRKILRCLLITLAFGITQAEAQNPAGQDSTLVILQNLLNQEYAFFSKQKTPCYHLQFQIEERQVEQISYNFGHQEYDRIYSPERTVTVTVAVGTPSLNSMGQQLAPATISARLPLSEVQSSIWGKIIHQATIEAYRDAVAKFNRLIADTILSGLADPIREAVLTDTFHYEPPVEHPEFHRQEFEEKIANATRICAPAKDVLSCTGTLQYRNLRNYCINTSGAVLVWNQPTATMTLTLKDEHQRVSHQYLAEHPDDLPPTEILISKITELQNQLGSTTQRTSATAKGPILPRLYDENASSTGNFPDIILYALHHATERTMAEMDIHNGYPPCFVSYLVSDARHYNVVSAFGEPIHREEYTTRTILPTIRIGNNMLSNAQFHDERFQVFSPLSTDNSYNAMSYDLWRATDTSYKRAIIQYIEKQQDIIGKGIDPQTLVPERSDGDIRTDIQLRDYEPIDLGLLQSVTDELSTILSADTLTQIVAHASAAIEGLQGNAYYYDSEHIEYAQPYEVFCISIAATLQDGTTIQRQLVVKEPQEIRNRETILQWAKQCVSAIAGMHTAPRTTCRYGGPVLVCGQAAGEWLAQSTRQLATLRAQYDAEPDIFSQNLDKKTISPILDFNTADHLTSHNGIALVGSYPFDAEGIAPEPNQEIIRRGELIALFANRTPIQKKNYSNGHQRLAIEEEKLIPQTGAGVIQVKSHNTQNDNKLIQLLLKQAKAEGYKSAYLITNLEVRDGVITGIELYQISMNGKRTLVRGARMEPEWFWDLQQVVATSQTMVAHNALVNGRHYPTARIPVSIIAPDALLFNHLSILPTR